MFNTLIRRSCGVIKATKPRKAFKKNYLFQKFRGGAQKKLYGTSNAINVPWEPEFVSLIKGALVKLGLAYGMCRAYFNPYWKARRVFEGPQQGDYANLDELTTKYYIKRNTDDVNKIRRELSPCAENTKYPYTAIIGPCKTGKTELAKECAQQSGVRYIYDQGLLPTYRTFWEAVARVKQSEIDMSTAMERQLELILYGAKVYKKKHGKVPVLIFDDQLVQVEYTEFVRKWAKESSQHIKVVFMGESVPDAFAADHPQQLTLGGLSTDETRKYLRMRLEIDPPSNSTTPTTDQSNTSSMTSNNQVETSDDRKTEVNPLWYRRVPGQSGRKLLTRNQVIAAIDQYIDVVGCDLRSVVCVKDIDSLDSIVGLNKSRITKRSRVYSIV